MFVPKYTLDLLPGSKWYRSKVPGEVGNLLGVWESWNRGAGFWREETLTSQFL